MVIVSPMLTPVGDMVVMVGLKRIELLEVMAPSDIVTVGSEVIEGTTAYIIFSV